MQAPALEMRVLTPDGPEWPAPLQQGVLDPPARLWAIGPLNARYLEPAVAIVGSRRPTAYGLAMAERLAADLAAAGVTVVSGLALGIDTAAHRGALRAQGRTVAVLGCGVDRIHPQSSAREYEEIRRNGLILSEYPPGTPPLPHHFPYRNRLISGLCLGVVVVEAALRSGTLKTVDHALAQGREVFALPGPAGSALSAGPHRLIRTGARLITCAADLLADLGLPAGAPEPLELPAGGGADGARLLQLLDRSPARADALAAALRWPVSRALGALTALELSGQVERLADGSFHKIPPGGRV